MRLTLGLHHTWHEIHDHLVTHGTGLESIPDGFEPAYGIRPGDPLNMLMRGDERLKVVPARWGLSMPGRASDDPRCFARLETARQEHPISKMLSESRCLVPVSGIHDPVEGEPAKSRSRTLIGGAPAFLAGVFQEQADGLSVAILTLQPLDPITSSRGERVPCVVPVDKAARWCDPGVGEAGGVIACPLGGHDSPPVAESIVELPDGLLG